MPFRLVIFISLSANSSQPHPCHHIINFSLKLQSPTWLPFCTISAQPGVINTNTHAGQQHTVCLSQKDLSFPCWYNDKLPKMQWTKIYKELKKKILLNWLWNGENSCLNFLFSPTLQQSISKITRVNTAVSCCSHTPPCRTISHLKIHLTKEKSDPLSTSYTKTIADA